MIVTYYGLQFFKFQVGDLTMAYNPFGKEHGRKPPKFSADIALSSMRHPDFNALEQLEHGGSSPFLITGPGEYEISGVMVSGVGVPTRYDGAEHINTAYSIQLEGMKLGLLGAVSSADEITEDVRAALGHVDILFVPIAGGDVLAPRDAQKVSVSFAPALIIPMHIEPADAQSKKPSSKELSHFLEEAGKKDIEPVPKLTLKKKDIEGKEGNIAVLSAQ